MKRSGISILLVFLLAGCGSGEDPVDALAAATAAQVIAAVEGSAGTPESAPPVDRPPEGCRIELQTDEYGFDVEVTVCDEVSDLRENGAPLLEWLGSSDALRLSRRLTELILLQTACEDIGMIDLAEFLAADAPGELRSALLDGLADLRSSAAVCNADVVAWQEGLEAALDDFESAIALIEEAGSG